MYVVNMQYQNDFTVLLQAYNVYLMISNCYHNYVIIVLILRKDRKYKYIFFLYF